MSNYRIYQDIVLAEANCITLSKDAAHHLANVLRAKTGEELTLFNGDGFDYFATISAISKKTVECVINDKKLNQAKPLLPVHLFQSVARGEKMDWIIQKSIELGASSITPIFTERTNVKLNQERLKKRMIHWQKVLISACEQSGQSWIPELHQPLSFTEMLKSLNFNLHKILIMDPRASTGLSEIGESKEYSIVIGPEGGLAEKEIKQLQESGALGVKMGPRILRTETAAMAMLTALHCQYGDLQ